MRQFLLIALLSLVVAALAAVLSQQPSQRVPLQVDLWNLPHYESLLEKEREARPLGETHSGLSAGMTWPHETASSPPPEPQPAPAVTLCGDMPGQVEPMSPVNSSQPRT